MCSSTIIVQISSDGDVDFKAASETPCLSSTTDIEKVRSLRSWIYKTEFVPLPRPTTQGTITKIQDVEEGTFLDIECQV